MPKPDELIRHSNDRFEDSEVALDGHFYDGCVFVKCVLAYRGEKLVRIWNCSFTECRFHFEAAAGNTISFLNGLAGDPGLSSAFSYIIPNLRLAKGGHELEEDDGINIFRDDATTSPKLRN